MHLCSLMLLIVWFPHMIAIYDSIDGVKVCRITLRLNIDLNLQTASLAGQGEIVNRKKICYSQKLAKLKLFLR